MEEAYDTGGVYGGRPLFSDFPYVWNLYDWLHVLGSPARYATLKRVPVPSHLSDLTSVFIAYAARGSRYAPGTPRKDTPYEQREPLARKLHALMEIWTPPELPPEIAITAEKILEAEGLWVIPYEEGEEAVEDILLWPEGIPRLLREAVAREADAGEADADEADADEVLVEPQTPKDPR
jgi:hypothetical protein